jgi:hypothetical protein
MPAWTKNVNSDDKPKTKQQRRYDNLGVWMRSRKGWLALLIAILALLASGWAVWEQVSTARAQHAAQQQAKDVADPVAALCASDPSIYAQLSADSKARWDRACSKAAEVQNAPAPQTPAAGPSDSQVAAAVDAWLAAHPPPAGQNATPAMVATAVAQFLVANPPEPGRPPTAAEIATAASTYITAHADDFQGPAGKNATDTQVQAAVSAYCGQDTGPCRGPVGDKGDTGPQGVSIADVNFERDNTGTCQVIVTLHDPATGNDSTVTHPAGDAACPTTSSQSPTP